MGNLTDRGRQQFREELAEAAAFGGEGDVLARWWTMLVARHDPGHERHFGAGRAREGFQTTDELRAEVRGMRAWWHDMVLRHDPCAREAFARPEARNRPFQTTADLRAEVEAMVRAAAR